MRCLASHFYTLQAIDASENMKYLVHASYLEIYNEDIRDLLGQDIKKKLELKEHPDRGVYVKDISLHAVSNTMECEAMMAQGWKNRATGATKMNADSSRSHSIFTINIEMMDSGGAGHIRKVSEQRLVRRVLLEREGYLNVKTCPEEKVLIGLLENTFHVCRSGVGTA